MWIDVSDLCQFYGSPLGKLTQRLLLERFRYCWPNLTGKRVLSLGYGTPYMRRLNDKAERSLAAMPQGQGVIHWPPHQPSSVVLTEENKLPFPDNSIDRILLIHAVEFTEHLRPMLREAWRTLASGGRVLAVVPNRRGVWAQLESTPFGHGQPYSEGQLDRLLRDCLFSPIRSDFALYAPPSKRRIIRRVAPTWERLGRRWLRPFSGVVLIEAEKQVYAVSSGIIAKNTSPRKLRPILDGLTYTPLDSSSRCADAAANKKTPCAPNRFAKTRAPKKRPSVPR